MTPAQQVGRRPRNPTEVAGPNSVKAKSCEAVLTHVDWSNYTKSNIWTKEYPPREALQQVIDSGRAEKLAGSHERNWIVIHTFDTLLATVSKWVSEDGEPGVGPVAGKSVRNLFVHGYKAIRKDRLELKGYTWSKRLKQILRSNEWPSRAETRTQDPDEAIDQTSTCFQTAASRELRSPYRSADTISVAPHSNESSHLHVTDILRKRKAMPKRYEGERSAKRLVQELEQPVLARNPKPVQHHSDDTMPDRTRFFLDSDALASRLQTLFRSIGHHVRSALQAQSVYIAAPAKLSKQPSSGLESAYTSLLGSWRQSEQSGEASVHALDVDDFAISLVGVGIQDFVFDGSAVKSLLFETRHDCIRSAIGPLWSPSDHHLQSSSTNLDTVLRQAYLSLVRRHEQPDVSQTANMVTGSVSDLLLAHLRAHPGLSTDGIVTKRWWDSLAPLVLEAVRLRCEVSCARERYAFRWPQRWQPFDGAWMETSDAAGGNAIVATFSPSLSIDRDGSSEVISKATVRVI